MNWQDLDKRLDEREKKTMQAMINQDDMEEVRELQLKIRIYREMKRDIKSIVEKGK